MDTLLPTQMFPRLPACATFVADTQFVHFVSATNVSQFARHGNATFIVSRAFARPRNIMSNNVSSFASTFKDPGKRGHIVADTNVSPFARARNICCGHKFCVRDTKNVSDFLQKHFVSATNVSQFAQPKKHLEQQCVLVCQYL